MDSAANQSPTTAPVGERSLDIHLSDFFERSKYSYRILRMVSYNALGQAASVTSIFLHLVGEIGDENDESGRTSFFLMVFASQVCSIPTPLNILYNGVDVHSLDSLLPEGSSSKLFYFFKVFWGI